MTRYSKVTNHNLQEVTLETVNGLKVTIPPGCGLKDSDMKPLEGIPGVKSVPNLTEVKEDSGKMRLDG